MICTLILVIGLVGIAGLLAVTTRMHIAAQEAARSTRLAQDTIDELMKLDFTTDAEVSVGGSLDSDQADHFDPAPPEGITIRWEVENGPVDDTRILTVRVDNIRTATFGRQIELSTIVRNW